MVCTKQTQIILEDMLVPEHVVQLMKQICQIKTVLFLKLTNGPII